MPIATLQYNLPEENHEFELAINATKIASLLWDIAEFTRKKMKHGELTEEQSKIIEELNKEIIEFCDDHDFSLSILS